MYVLYMIPQLSLQLINGLYSRPTLLWTTLLPTLDTIATSPSLDLMSTFLTLSNIAPPSTLLRHLISRDCILLLSLSSRVQVSHAYNRVGITVALITLSFVALLSSLQSITYLFSHGSLPPWVTPCPTSNQSNF